ncbi:MAG: enoyl-CoA hydratase/isomerase family protein [Vampirovibrionales bacterium]|nr:enoyl-CoA hydratase/isomerase family protein [Vampirovibrionales bacterium]
MQYQYIQVSDEPISDLAVVRTIHLNRPDVHNAFNDDMIAELQSAFKDLETRDEIRAVIIAASGNSFCAGADLNWMKRMVDYSFEENKADALALAEMLKSICECPKPVIARIQGNAFGGGVGLLSACDMTVAISDANFALTEVKLGLIPAVISPFVLRRMSVNDAQRYFLTGERFNAEQAQRFGLLQEAVLDEVAMDDWIKSRIEAIVSNGPEAVTQAKRLIHQVLETQWPRVLDITSTMIAERRASIEGQEGMRAFLEKRKPSWVVSQGASKP